MSRIGVRSNVIALLTCVLFLLASFGCSNPGGITAPDSALDGAVVDAPNPESISSPPSDGSDEDGMFSRHEDING